MHTSPTTWKYKTPHPEVLRSEKKNQNNTSPEYKIRMKHSRSLWWKWSDIVVLASWSRQCVLCVCLDSEDGWNDTFGLALGFSCSSFLAAASMDAAAPKSSVSAITVGSSGSTHSEPERRYKQSQPDPHFQFTYHMHNTHVEKVNTRFTKINKIMRWGFEPITSCIEKITCQHKNLTNMTMGTFHRNYSRC